MKDHIANFFRYILMLIVLIVIGIPVLVTWPFAWLHEKAFGFLCGVLGLDGE